MIVRPTTLDQPGFHFHLCMHCITILATIILVTITVLPHKRSRPQPPLSGPFFVQPLKRFQFLRNLLRPFVYCVGTKTEEGPGRMGGALEG